MTSLYESELVVLIFKLLTDDLKMKFWVDYRHIRRFGKIYNVISIKRIISILANKNRLRFLYLGFFSWIGWREDSFRLVFDYLKIIIFVVRKNFIWIVGMIWNALYAVIICIRDWFIVIGLRFSSVRARSWWFSERAPRRWWVHYDRGVWLY